MKNGDIKVNKPIKILGTIIILVLLFALLSLSISYAWFYNERKTIGLEEISNPTAIYINSGNAESHIYIDLGLIDVSKGDYKDVVFCVRGIHVNYMIQLAYTTNNQFEFEIYPFMLL